MGLSCHGCYVVVGFGVGGEGKGEGEGVGGGGAEGVREGRKRKKRGEAGEHRRKQHGGRREGR